jgi:hypothetical protein
MKFICARVIESKTEAKVCGTEMKCLKTGMDVLVHPNYGYRGDIMECPNCGARVCAANDEGFNSPTPYKRDKWTIDLNQ